MLNFVTFLPFQFLYANMMILCVRFNPFICQTTVPHQGHTNSVLTVVYNTVPWTSSIIWY
jgi:hypothetical protein